MEIQNHIFESVVAAVDVEVPTDVELFLIRSEVTNGGGDTETVGDYESIERTFGENFMLDQTKVQVIDDEFYYAHAIYKTFHEDPTITLLEWIETDEQVRQSGIGRLLLERTIDHIEQTTETEQVYAKVENTHMLGPLVDCGFTQEPTLNPGDWYVLEM